MFLPSSRNADIIVQSAGSELLVYDLKTNKAFNLNETSALIYQYCDGKTTFADFKLKYRNLSDDIIYFALDELKANDLIESDYQSGFTGVSRRDVIKKVGLASMMALPIVVSITAPKAVYAQSCSCPSNEPTGCRFGFTYSIGCFPNSSSCISAGNASAGTFANGNHCCFGPTGANAVSFNSVSGCCSVTCLDIPPV